MSAFDIILKQHILALALEAAGGPINANQSLLYLANCLSNCRTFLEFNSIVMGPIHDTSEAKQGGKLSSEEFQLVNNKELIVYGNLVMIL